ncbi:uridine kinase [Halomicrobium katesii]|uniref:uridine kinase n=1 Tax=Halomicrobium katesii TaxID=437163 RepID=UPI000365276E|nr:uridine kinase [Halomicrobium katesii]
MADAFVLGIAGGSGAGKSTIARDLSTAVDPEITIISLDDYYEDLSELPLAEREDRNFDHPDAIDWDRLVADVEALSRGETVTVPQYDFEKHARAPTSRTVDPGPIVVLEGIFALYHDRIVAQLDLALYVQTDADVRVLRRLQRDVTERGRTVDGVVEQYLSTVKPMHEQFVEPTKENADLIVPEGTNPAVIDVLREKVASEMAAHREAATEL